MKRLVHGVVLWLRRRRKKVVVFLAKVVAEGVWYDWQFRKIDRWEREQEEGLTSAGVERREDVRTIRREADERRRHLHWEREVGFTRRLVRRARRLRVHVPIARVYQDGDWTTTEGWSEGPFRWEAPYLNAQGIRMVREAIREEQRWRIERRNAWLPFLAAATGLLGTAIGLIAVLGGP